MIQNYALFLGELIYHRYVDICGHIYDPLFIKFVEQQFIYLRIHYLFGVAF